jgi:15-cis-phytoene desaturase
VRLVSLVPGRPAVARFSKTVGRRWLSATSVLADDPKRKAPDPDAKKFFVLGAGIAGMSFVHEILKTHPGPAPEITVVDAEAIPGGKARSFGDGKDEHALRIFGYGYKLFPELLREVPLANGRTSADHLTALDTYTLVDPQSFGRVKVPCRLAADKRSFRAWSQFLKTGEYKKLPVTIPDALHLTKRALYYFSSCKERRSTEIENQTFADFVQIDKLSPGARRLFHKSPLLFAGVTADEASGWIFACKVGAQTLGGFTPTGAVRVLNGPTNDVLINPWMAQHQAAGVSYQLNTSITGLQVDNQNNCISGIDIHTKGETPKTLNVRPQDVVISALSIQGSKSLLPQMDERTAQIKKLNSKEMIGVQIHLGRDVPMTDHQILFGTEWGLIAFVHNDTVWPEFPVSEMGDRKAKSSISLAFVEMDVPGKTGRTVRECTELSDIEEEIRLQLLSHFKEEDHPEMVAALTQDVVGFTHSEHLQLATDGNEFHYGEALAVNEPGDYQIRQLIRHTDGLDNLYIGSGFAGSPFGLESMENAAHAGVLLAHTLMRKEGQTTFRTLPDYELLPSLRPIRKIDEAYLKLQNWLKPKL